MIILWAVFPIEFGTPLPKQQNNPADAKCQMPKQLCLEKSFAVLTHHSFLGGGNSNIFGIFTPNPAKIIEFDLSNLIFKLAWNHQLDFYYFFWFSAVSFELQLMKKSSRALIQVHTDKVYDWFRYVGYLRWAELLGGQFYRSGPWADS